MKIVILFLMLFFLTCNKTKKSNNLVSKDISTNEIVFNDSIMPKFENDLRKERLSGPVKEYRVIRVYDKNSVSKKKHKLYASATTIDYLPHRGLRKFDKHGIKTYSGGLKDSLSYKRTYTFNNITKEYLTIYKYHKSDFDKIKNNTQKKVPSYIFNPLNIKLSKIDYANYTYEVRKDSSYKKINKAYKYNFDLQNNILKESKYIIWDFNLDGIIDEEELEFTVNYKYNNKNQLIAKDYDFVKRVEINYQLEHDLSFSAATYKPIEKFTYNKHGDLTSAYMYKNKEERIMVYSEDYYYNNKNELIKLKRRKSFEQMIFYSDLKRTNEFFYNKKGEIVKINALENDEKTIHATFLYTYENYDKYNNWLKCNMYLDGVIKKKPTMVIDRLIKYY